MCLNIGDRPAQINVVERPDDLEGFVEFVRANRRGGLGFDTETTGLDWWASGFRLRLAQFATADESWVIPVEAGAAMAGAAAGALRHLDKVFVHHAAFDLLVADRHLGVPIDDLWPKAADTGILAHLVDPRGADEGGTGHSLAALTAAYLDPDIGSRVKGSMTEVARDIGTTKARVWSEVPIDHGGYLTYAAADPILTYRLAETLEPQVPATSRNLIGFEHRVAYVCALIEKRGFALDVDYAEALVERLTGQERRAVDRAAALGCANVQSGAAVAEALQARGVELTARTKTGKPKVGKEVLEPLADAGDDLAKAIIAAKRARKQRVTWVEKFLDNRDSQDRCHASIHALRARTGRMSITGIPAQTLPSGDSLIRSCFVADEGHQIMAVDYQAQELRILAALAKDETMLEAFASGEDLHQLTADAAGVAREHGKTGNFGYVFGGSAATLAAQCGASEATMRRVVKGFESTYRRIVPFSKRLQRVARRDGYITTPVGRRLPVEPRFAFRALNYLVQSTGRDVTCRALLRIHDAGLTQYVRLPIHDELLLSIPAQHTTTASTRIGGLMSEQFGSVHLATESRIGQRSWGSLYEMVT